MLGHTESRDTDTTQNRHIMMVFALHWHSPIDGGCAADQYASTLGADKASFLFGLVGSR
jgi:hypothetical protein